jgi:hypothetical protein
MKGNVHMSSANESTANLVALKRVLSGEFNLKPKFELGKQSFYRLWQTIELFDPYGDVLHRNQWRGDFGRKVESVNESGEAREAITWHSVGVRTWNAGESRYGPARELPYARGFSYTLSIEDDYKDLNWDYSAIPRSIEGSTFRQAFTVTAHFEFDFLRSISHAAIDRLRKLGDLISDPPEEGKTFSLSFPPVVRNSLLERQHIHIGLLGLNLFDGEPCALLLFRQGPQKFSWDGIEGPDITAEGMYEDNVWHKDLKSWQEGHLSVRLADGGLAEGELWETHMIKRARPGGDDPVAVHSRGIWSIRAISSEAYSKGLMDWNQDQSDQTWHCLFGEFRARN